MKPVMGSFWWAISTVPFPQWHFRQLQSFFQSYSQGNLDFVVTLPSWARADLLSEFIMLEILESSSAEKAFVSVSARSYYYLRCFFEEMEMMSARPLCHCHGKLGETLFLKILV
jgi:hypothetical protein